MLDGPHIFQHLTVPSLVSQQGHHISHTLPSLPQHHQSLGRDISQDASGGRIYIKLPAFGETLYLNLSLSSSDLAGMETLVNYVRGEVPFRHKVGLRALVITPGMCTVMPETVWMEG